jgi:hypothetical protein
VGIRWATGLWPIGLVKLAEHGYTRNTGPGEACSARPAALRHDEDMRRFQALCGGDDFVVAFLRLVRSKAISCFAFLRLVRSKAISVRVPLSPQDPGPGPGLHAEHVRRDARRGAADARETLERPLRGTSLGLAPPSRLCGYVAMWLCGYVAMWRQVARQVAVAPLDRLCTAHPGARA